MNKKIILSTLILLAVIGFYFIFKNQNKEPIEANQTSEDKILYKNQEYGFSFDLPKSWTGYSVIESTWRGYSSEHKTLPAGTKIIIRNPKWSEDKKYEDIPILIFPISQWDEYTSDEFSVSAAPIQATEMARNNTYVFALPARWNFDYNLDFEEAEDIINNKPITTFDSTPDLKCYYSEKYFIIEKSLSPDTGSNIVVKNKNNKDQEFECSYTVTKDDFKIKNTEAQYFLDISNNFILLDQGTSPEPRKLIVYNINLQKIVFEDYYMKQVGVNNDDILYFSKSETEANKQNCPEFENYQKNGLGAIIMTKIKVNLTTLNKIKIGENKCIATQ